MSLNEDSEQCAAVAAAAETDDFKEPLPKTCPEAAEEAKLRGKYPNIRPAAAGSALLQKRLQKGQKYFDSGDYQMAKQRGACGLGPLRGAGGARAAVTGDTIPTPDTLPARQMPLHGRNAH